MFPRNCYCCCFCCCCCYCCCCCSMPPLPLPRLLQRGPPPPYKQRPGIGGLHAGNYGNSVNYGRLPETAGTPRPISPSSGNGRRKPNGSAAVARSECNPPHSLRECRRRVKSDQSPPWRLAAKAAPPGLRGSAGPTPARFRSTHPRSGFALKAATPFNADLLNIASASGDYSRLRKPSRAPCVL